MASDPLLEGLDDTQREAITTRDAPLAVLAGAGAGKTRVLTRRIAWQARQAHVDARHVLALTFTRKAAGELVERLERLGVRHQVTSGTFHAIALAQLRRRCADRDRPMPRLIQRKVRLLAPMLGGRGPKTALDAADVAAEIEWAKARLVTPEAYEASVAGARRTPPRPPADVASLYERYEREKRRRGVADFDDLIWWCGQALETDAEFRAVQRWRFRHVFVDEFQDVNPAQFRLVRAWLGDHSDLCVVGDPAQAIYAFTGADPAYLTRFTEHFPGAGVVRLGANYRSSPQVVRVASAVIAGAGDGRGAPRAIRPDGPVATLTKYPTDEAEARAVARRARREHVPGRAWSSLAVLYRTNAQSALFEEALRREGVPYRVRGGERFLDRPEVQVAMDDLRRSTRTAPGRSFRDHLADLAESSGVSNEERREHVDALVRLGREYLAADGAGGSLDGFVDYLEAALRGDDGAPGRDAVELLSFHRAKGLEFGSVFVTGLERGLVPISHAEAPAEIEEERRLLYVAVSRAERALHVTWAERRTVGMRTYTRTASPWLEKIESAIATSDTAALQTKRRQAPAALTAARARADAAMVAQRAGRRGEDVRPPDPDLLAALKEWRRSAARAAGVQPFVVFHDKVLRAVATSRPRTHRELLAVTGIGPVKAQRYGRAVLDVVRRHAAAATGH